MKKIQYVGDSIGQDIHIEINILGQVFSMEQTIKQGSTVELDRIIAKFPAGNQGFNAKINIKIVEKDFLFNDVGSTSGMIQEGLLNLEVKVREWKKFFRRSTAIFTITFEVKAVESMILKQYRAPKANQDYNRFDDEIIMAVNQWNGRFAAQLNPPPTLLDPNLVKAIIYVESDMGYYKCKGYYPGYPDVMQVADPRNYAIYALKNIFNPKLNRTATEYEVLNGKTVPLEYLEANAEKPETSIYWGVRWLYHLAQ